MKKYLIILVMVCTTAAYSQKGKIVGSWLVTKVEVKGEVENPYKVTDYNEDGRMVMMGIDVGAWNYNKKNKSIVMKSDFDKDFNGEGKILKLTDKELVVLKDGIKVFYKKLDLDKIAKANKDSGLLGSWQFEKTANASIQNSIDFKEPDGFTMIQKQEGMMARMGGTWVFDKDKMSLLMIGLRGEDTFKGENKVLYLNEETLELENNHELFKATRKVESTAEEERIHEVEHLTFYFEDFFNEDWEYIYGADKEKLPWNNWEAMKKDLLNVKQLVYRYDFKNDGEETFKHEILIANVSANIEYEGFTIENIFTGYDTTGNGEPRSNTDYYMPLYPLEDNVFRLAGSEQITTPAGIFDCTVIELSNGYDMKKKLWMINDKVGIYAKIIDENTSEYSYYHVYELQEIK